MEVRDNGEVIGHMDVERRGTHLRAMRLRPLVDAPAPCQPSDFTTKTDLVTIPFQQWAEGSRSWWALDATGIDMTNVAGFRPQK